MLRLFETRTAFTESLRLSRLRQSVLAVAAVTLAGYLLIFALLYLRRHDLGDFILISKTAITQSQASAIIKFDPSYSYLEGGYDGQFFYFMALDPAKGYLYCDTPLRYIHILYPMLARLLALGNPGWVPLTLILVNLAGVTLGTGALAAWCKQHQLSPWLALIYAFYVGQVMGFSRDLSDVVSYGLVALAIYLFDRKPQNLFLAGLVFGLAGLARQTCVIFGGLYLIQLFLEQNRKAERGAVLRAGLIFGLLALGPALIWQAIVLAWLNVSATGAAGGLLRWPYSGLVALFPFTSDVLQVIQVVLVPATICLVVAIWTIWQDKANRWRVEIWALLIHAVLFAILLHPSSLVELFATARISSGVVLAAILCLPYTKNRIWFWLCAGLWLAPTLSFVLGPMLELWKKRFGATTKA